MIKHHPTDHQLKRFAQGQLDTAVSLVLSAHVDMCSHCQTKLARMEQQLAETWLDRVEAAPDNMNDMLEAIMRQPEQSIVAQELPQTIELDGRQFKLPRTLRRFAGKTNNWSHLVGKLWQAPVEIGGEQRAHFIYMEKGGRVPEHTHKGSELTLVLDGEFSDGLDNYDTGDLVLMDANHTHAPLSEATEGCLVFTLVDKPLHFTQGFARMLNPFSHLFF